MTVSSLTTVQHSQDGVVVGVVVGVCVRVGVGVCVRVGVGVDVVVGVGVGAGPQSLH